MGKVQLTAVVVVIAVNLTQPQFLIKELGTNQRCRDSKTKDRGDAFCKAILDFISSSNR